MYKQRTQTNISQTIFWGITDMFFLKHAFFVSVVALSCLTTQGFATDMVPQDEGMMQFLFCFRQ